MTKIQFLKDIPKSKHAEIQAFCDACMAHEEFLNTHQMCWFISERFYQRFKNKLFVFDETKKDGIRGVAMLHFEKGKMICISHLFVKQKFRNHGIATSILKKTIKFAKKNGRKVFLNVNVWNEKAFSLYKKLGFTPDLWQSIRMTFEK